MSAMRAKLLWNMGACGPQSQADYPFQEGKVGDMNICLQAGFKIGNHVLEWLTWLGYLTLIFNFFLLRFA